MTDQRNHGSGPRLYQCPDIDELFPNAVAAIVAHSVYGSHKHNPGQAVHWAFGKSQGHIEKAIGHLKRAGQVDEETGLSHTINAAWRAVAALETELLRAGAIPGSRVRDFAREPASGPNCELGGRGE
jgi:hypothetical protein